MHKKEHAHISSCWCWCHFPHSHSHSTYSAMFSFLIITYVPFFSLPLSSNNTQSAHYVHTGIYWFSYNFRNRSNKFVVYCWLAGRRLFEVFDIFLFSGKHFIVFDRKHIVLKSSNITPTSKKKKQLKKIRIFELTAMMKHFSYFELITRESMFNNSIMKNQ